MIIGIQLPKGSHVIVQDDKVLIVLDDKAENAPLWKKRILIWLVDGSTVHNFWTNTTLACYEMQVTMQNKLNMVFRK